MKILVVCQYYYPEEFQINAICEGLVERGHDVTVLTGLPNYPTGVIPAAYQDGKRRTEEYHGVKIQRCFEVPRRKGVIGLARNYLSFCFFSCKKVLSLPKDFDVVYIYQLSPVLMGIPGILYKKLARKKVFLYCCDLWPESVKIMNIREKSAVFRVLKAISTFIYRNCDRIGIQSKAFYRYFKEAHDIEQDKLCYIPQFADSAYLEKDFNVPHEGFNFVFLGNIGIAQNLDCLVKAAALLKDLNGFKVHIVGDGSYLEKMKELVRDNSLEDKFIFYGRRPVSEMTKFYCLADACLLTLEGKSIIGQTIPSKLQGYMAAGKAVAAAIDGAAQGVILEADCGRAVAAGDADGLSGIMRDMVLHAEKYQACGSHGRRYFTEHFTKEHYIDRTEKEMKALVSGGII